jgi:type IV pilus assembly protein PilB
VSKGFITDEQLSEALVESRNSGERLGLVLLRKGFVFGAELARALSEQWGIPYLNLSVISVDRRVVHLLPQEIGTKFAAIPVRYLEGAVQVAFADPSDPEALAAVRAHIPAIAPAVAELADIASAWRGLRPAG